jgi:hypothetical protein
MGDVEGPLSAIETMPHQATLAEAAFPLASSRQRGYDGPLKGRLP